MEFLSQCPAARARVSSPNAPYSLQPHGTSTLTTNLRSRGTSPRSTPPSFTALLSSPPFLPLQALVARRISGGIPSSMRPQRRRRKPWVSRAAVPGSTSVMLLKHMYGLWRGRRQVASVLPHLPVSDGSSKNHDSHTDAVKH